MNKGWLILALAALAVRPGFAQEPDEAEALPTGKLTVEEAHRLLATGRAAYEDGLNSLARRRLETLVAGAPDRRRQAEAALWLARVLLAEKKPDEARAVLDAQAGQVRAAALASEYALVRAQAFLDARRPEDAAAELADFQDKYAGEAAAPAALRLLAGVNAARGAWPEAEAACRLIEARHPGNPAAAEAWLELAGTLAAAGRPEEAQKHLAYVETNYAGQVWSEQALLEASRLQLTQGERAPAMKRLRALVADTNRMAETRTEGYRILAQALGMESNFTASLEMIDRGIAATADPARQQENEVVKAHLLLLAGRVEEGADLLRTVAARIPDRNYAAQIQLDLAGWLAQLARWEEAVAEYQSWLDAFAGTADTAEAQAGLALALWSAGRREEAAAAYERAGMAESDPVRRLELQLKAGDVLFATRQFHKAKAAYDRVLAAAPAGGELALRAQFQLAETELALGETEASEVRLLDLSRAKAESEISRAATLRLGALYEDRGALETAMEQYGRLIGPCSEPETCSQALLARGLIQFRTGAFPQALDDFGRIRDQLPQTKPAAQAMFMYGWCLYMLGKDDEALAVCTRFLTEYPASEFAPDVRFWLGEKAFNHGNYLEAERRFASVAADHPASPRAADALYWAGRAASARRDYLAANEHYNALMAGYPDSPRLAATLLAQGDVLSELGQFAAAILAFNEVIVKAPRPEEAMVAWGRKGDCQYTLGQENPARYEEALLSYRTLLDYAGVPPDLRLQAGFKVGRCLEKMGRATAALDRYMEVVYGYLQEESPPAEAVVWFTRAAFAAAALQENAGHWPEAAGIYRRVADAGVPAAAEARMRMERIRREHGVAF